MINDNEIRRWFAVFKSADKLTEVRILGDNKTFSGYYTDVETLLRDIHAYDGYGIYAPINTIKSACYSRLQRDNIIQRPKETTSDNDIAIRRIILIDIDPQRPSGVNATDAEVERAHEKAREIFRFLRTQGFEEPVIAESGNGFHLYYRVYIENTKEATTLIKSFLEVLDMMFSDNGDGGAKIDTSVYNAARIAKIIGTTSNKGSNTQDRPQRLSRFIYIPQQYKETDVAYVKKVAQMLPEPEKPDRYNNYQPRQFDLRKFISDHGIEVVKESRYANGTRFILKECPFDHNHKDAAVFQLDNGALGFACFHQSCQNYHWRDFVLHYDPSAYDKSASEDFNRRRRYNAPVKQEEIQPTPEDIATKGKKWMRLDEFKYFDIRDAKAIPFGIPDLDRKVVGLILGEVTVLSGSSGSGKTTFINHIILNAVQRNYRVALWSGEMSGGRIAGWIDQMAAGKNNVTPIEGTDGLYSVPAHIRKKINEWIGDRLLVYNNSYGQRWSQLSADIKENIAATRPNLIIVDNLMALDLDSFDGENNDKQKAFINELTDIAARENVHIILVAHPRKENLSQLIRKESIAGTADLTNLAFNVILLHRTGQDFERRGKEFFGAGRVADLMQYSVVVEVNKARTPGYQDLLVGLYYEPETRRLKNDPAENIIYGWQDAPTPIEDYDDLPPDDYEEKPREPYYNNF